jgi:excisionase family DNA binding protein
MAYYADHRSHIVSYRDRRETSITHFNRTIRKPIGASTMAQESGVLGSKWAGRDTLTVDEAGKILGLNRWTAYAYVQNGTIPAVRLGKRWIVPRHAIERLLLSACAKD